MHPSLILSLIIFRTAWVTTAAPNSGKCYNTDQVQDGSYFPCDPEAEVSFCCQSGRICLSNGLCEPSSNVSSYDTPYFTALCTDYSWKSPSTCLEICDNNKTGQVIFYDVVLLGRIVPTFGREQAMLTLIPLLVCIVSKTPLMMNITKSK